MVTPAIQCILLIWATNGTWAEVSRETWVSKAKVKGSKVKVKGNKVKVKGSKVNRGINTMRKSW